jgi:hypothetical protein
MVHHQSKAGLLFFIGGDTPLFEEKQYLLDLIASRTEFDGVPLAVIFERGQRKCR